MGIDPRRLTDQQVGLVDPGQRKGIVKARGFDTADKRKAKIDAKLERELHNQYIGFLRRNELAYVHANPVKPSTIQKGCPDFTVTGGVSHGYRCLYGEFKMPGGTLGPDQVKYIAYLTELGCKVYVWYDYPTAIKDTSEFFSLGLGLLQ